MRWAELLREIRSARALHADRIMRFEEAYGVWTGKRLSQEEAARILGVCSVHSTAIAGVITDTRLRAVER